MTKSRSDENENSGMVELVIHSELAAAQTAEEQVLSEVEALGYRAEAAFAIRLSLEEAITNAIKHGNKNDRSKRIVLRYRVDDEKAVIRVADEGAGFNPSHIPDPTAPSRLSMPNGRGIMLMRAYMDEVRYNSRGNEVRLVTKKN